MEAKNNIPIGIRKYIRDELINQQVNQSYINAINDLKQNDPDKLDQYLKLKADQIKEEEDRLLAEDPKEDPMWENVKNAMRTTVQRINQGKIANALADIDENKGYLEDLDKVNTYNELIGSIQDIINGLNSSSITNVEKNTLETQFDDTLQQIKDLETYFKTEGRTSPVIRELMFDPKKITGIKDNIKLGLETINEGTTDFNDYKFGISGFLDMIGDAGKKLMNTVQLGANALEKIWGDEYATTHRALQTLPDGDPLIDKLLKSRQEISENKEQLSNTIADWNKAYQDKIDSIYDNVKAQYQNYTNGDISLSLFNKINLGTWDISDPEDISETFKKNQQLYQGDFTHPLYNLPEIGSTIQLMQNTMYTMGAAGLVKYLGSKLPVYAAGGPLTAAKVAVDLANTALIGGETMFALYNARQSRRNETAQEVIDALGQKMANKLDTENGNLQKVCAAILQNVAETNAAEGGVESPMYKQLSQMEPADIIQYGIANRIVTGDKVFDEALPNIHKGVQKLINDNNALAYTDYLETLPFMSYAGSALKQFGKNVSKAIGKGVVNAGEAAFSNFGKYGERGEQFFKNISQQAEFAAAAGQKFNYTKFPELGKIFDSAFTKAEKKIFETSPKLAFLSKRLGQSLKNYSKIVAPTAFVESSEEGVQHLLQQKFLRGEYDNQRIGYNIFALPDVFDDMNLSAQAWGAYLGVNYGDPDNGSDELRKAMNVGAMMSTVIPIGGSAIKSVLPESMGFEGGLGTLINQIRTDNAIINMIGESYGNNEDDNHIAIFHDALKRKGITASKLIRSLSDMKKHIGQDGSQLVSNDYIDRDIRAVIHTDAAMKNETLNNALSELGVEKNSEKYKQLIQLYVSHSLGKETIDKLIFDGNQKLQDLFSKQYEVMDNYFDPNISQEQKNQILEENPELVTMFEQMLQNRQSSSQEIRNRIQQSVDNKSNEILSSVNRLRVLNEESEEYKNLYKELSNQLSTIDTIQNYYVENSVDNAIQALQNDDSSVKSALQRGLTNLEKSKYTLLDASDQDYLKNHLGLIHMYQQQLRAKNLLEDSKNRQWLLEQIRRVTGLDINTEKIKGLSKAIERQVKQIEEIEQNILENVNSGNDNKITFDKLYGNNAEALNAQKQINKQIDELILNTAASDIENKMELIYRTLGISSPTINETIYGEEEADSELKQDVTDFNKIYQESINDPLLRQDPNINRSLSKISRKSAIAAIKKELAEKEERKRIMHRQSLEDGEVTENTVQEAINGDEAAAETLLSTNNLRNADQNSENANMQTADAETQIGQVSFDSQAYREERNRIEGIEVETIRKPKVNPVTIQQEIKETEKTEQGAQIVEDGDIKSAIESAIQSNDIPETEQQEIEDQQSESTNGSVEEEDKLSEEEQARSAVDKFLLMDEVQSVIAKEDEQSGLDPVQSGEIQDAIQQEETSEEIKSEIKDAVNRQDQIKNDIDRQIKEFTIEDLRLLSIRDGIMYYDGIQIPDSMTSDLNLETKLLSLLDFSFGTVNQTDLPYNSNASSEDKEKEYDENKLRQYVSQTFFYSINQSENGKPLKLTINGKQITLEHELRSAKELSKKLIEPGWFKNANKYYIVTQSQQDAEMSDNNPDNFTVALIIDDGQYSYAAVLRKLGPNLSKDDSGRIFDRQSHEQDVRDSLEKIGIDTYGLTGEEYQEKRRLARQEAAEGLYKAQHASSDPQPTPEQYSEEEYLIKLAEWKQRVQKWYTTPPNRNDFISDDAYTVAMAKWKRTSSLIYQFARQSMARVGKTPMTQEQIDAEINRLRDLRMQIIDAFLRKDENGKYIFDESDFSKMLGKVKPKIAQSSNGRIDSQRGGETGLEPIFRNVQNGTPQEITANIEESKLQLGLGLGVRGSERWLIRGLKPKTVMTYNGRGLGGKIYWMAPGINGGTVPIMLSEQKFNTQSRIVKGKTIKKIIGNGVKDNLRLCIDPTTGTIINNLDGYLPSAAEVILYLITGKLDSSLIPGGNQAIARSFGDLFIHCDESTLLGNNSDRKSLGKALPAYASKQLAWHSDGAQMVLTIGIHDNDSDSYIAQDFNELDLFGEQSEDTRRKVINAIASQFHWNTDENAMGSRFDSNEDKSITDIVEALRVHFQNTGDDSVSICGLPELTFNFSDLFDDDYNIKPVSVSGWMLSTGRLQTDTSENVFRDPFIFATGIDVAPTDALLHQMPKEKIDGTYNAKSVIDKNVDEILQQIKNIRGLKDFKIVSTDDERKTMLDDFNSTMFAKQNGGIHDVIAFDPTNLKTEESIKNKVNDFVNQYNNTSTIKIDTDKISYPAIKSKIPLLIKKQGLPLVKIYKNGSVVVDILNVASEASKKNIKFGVGGVFQRVKSGGRFNEKKAKKWLFDKLGIDDNNVIVKTGVMTSFQNDEYFGRLMIATDRITDEVVGRMMFSTDTSGAGSHYHEAWHYVNLLLHSPKASKLLYDEFIQKHPNLEYKTYEDVEEAMAEDFREYMEMRTSYSPKGLIKRFYNDVLDLLISTRRKSVYRAVYREIRKGKYKLDKINNQALEEFIKTYPLGIKQSFIIDGVQQSELDNLKHIDSYQLFYDTVEAAINHLFESFNIDSVKAMRSISGKQFNDVLEELREFAYQQHEQSQMNQILDLVNNPNVLRHALIEEFTKYGINAKIRKFNQQQTQIEQSEYGVDGQDVQSEEPQDDIETSNDGTETPDETDDHFDNVWDRFDLTLNKKDQASFNAKLFFRSIPMKEDIWLETGEVITVDMYTDFDGVKKLWDPDIAWKNILSFLWSCDSFEDVDVNGQYKPNSIRGRVKELAKSLSFFESVDERLNMLDALANTQTKSQIWSAISSSKPNVTYLQISDPVQYAKNTLLAYETQQDPTLLNSKSAVGYSDRQRVIQLFDDNRFSIMYSLPRQWSKNILFKGLVEVKNGRRVVSETYAKVLKEKLQEIRTLLGTINKKSTNQTDIANLLYTKGLKQKIVNLYNTMGIPVDLAVLDAYIATTALESDNTLTNSTFTASAQFYAIKKLMSSSASGSIGHFVDTINNSIGKTVLQPLHGEEKQLENLYDRYKRSKKSGYPDITKLALAYNQVHPTPEEFQVRLPNGDMAYPISNNNHRSNRTRKLNNEEGLPAEQTLAFKLAQSPYCRHSKILSAAQTLNAKSTRDDQLKLNAFVGMKDSNSLDGEDYFEISIMEDMISKMFLLENDHQSKSDKKNGIIKPAYLVPPIQADKKTYDTISSVRFRNFHDALVCTTTNPEESSYLNQWYWNNVEEQPKELNAKIEAVKRKNEFFKNEENKELVEGLKQQAYDEFMNKRLSRFKTFQNSTLQYFANQFLDELDYLIQYYSKENIQYLIDNPQERIKNFHGDSKYDEDLKQTRLQFNGNCGLFRYFYEIERYTDETNGYVYNMNQRMQMLWRLQHQIELGKVKSSINQNETIGTGLLPGDESNRDGFELIRQYLNDLRNRYFKINNSTGRVIIDDSLLTNVNSFLIDLVDEQLEKVCNPESQYQLGAYNEQQGVYLPLAIPEQMLQKYADDLAELELGQEASVYSSGDVDLQANSFYSLIANTVLNTMVSVIEDEKIFSGDPALFKYSKKESVKITDTFEFNVGGIVDKCTISLDVDELHDLFSDKIKRLGSTNSPGELVRLSYSQSEIKSLKNGENLNCKFYTNLNIQDINAKSVFYQENKDKVKKQVLIDIIRTSDLDVVNQLLNELKNSTESEKDKARINKEYLIGLIYSDRKIQDENITYEQYILNSLLDETISMIDDLVKSKTDPYGERDGEGNINVCDAQVLIRPELYRKIRLGLGQWSTEPDETGYCDEDAFWILENDAEWMSDPEKAAQVSKLQLYPLKMSYYQNDPTKIGNMNTNLAILNKMAIFPLFKYNSATEVATELYNRMNRSEQELDMVSFISAVKVGAKQKAVQILNSKADVENALSELATDESGNTILNRNSSIHVDYKTSSIIDTPAENVLPVTIQNIENLVMQLNTKAHTDEERAIGSQMSKLVLSGIIGDAQFCVGKKDRSVRSGSQIQEDIMGCVDVLSQLGAYDIEQRFYVQEHEKTITTVDKESGEKTEIIKKIQKHLNDNEVIKFVKSVIKNNNLGSESSEIIQHGGVIASLLSKSVFEQTIATAINKSIVDVNTHGGTAIQQSVFGFVASALGNKKVATQGKEGDVLVDQKGKQTITHSFHKFNNGEELQWNRKDGSMEVLLSMNYFKSVIPKSEQTTYTHMRQWLIDNDVIKGVKSDGTLSKPKPFGVGYRIPTQGLSSMFAFVVADVLPENAGDLIVVPREFTAQTGSDKQHQCSNQYNIKNPFNCGKLLNQLRQSAAKTSRYTLVE